MKILIVGNSQSACLKMAVDADSSLTGNHEVSFYVFPGGDGPYFSIEDAKLRVLASSVNSKFPPFASPESALHQRIDDYDCIVISALGYIDGGFLYPHPALTAGLIHGYLPKANSFVDGYISKACASRTTRSILSLQGGFRFLADLRASFQGPIIVQPFPLMSSAVQVHMEWIHRRIYDDPLGSYRFFLDIRDQFLQEACEAASAHLLPYPDTKWREALFTPAELMKASDGLHPLSNYGAMVLHQVADCVQSLEVNRVN